MKAVSNKSNATFSLKMEMSKNLILIFVSVSSLAMFRCIEIIGENNQQAFACFFTAVILVFALAYMKLTGVMKRIAEYDETNK